MLQYKFSDVDEVSLLPSLDYGSCDGHFCNGKICVSTGAGFWSRLLRDLFDLSFVGLLLLFQLLLEIALG